MRFLFLRANNFEGDQHPVEDTSINGTLEGDCTGIINFPFLGGIQPYAYYPDIAPWSCQQPATCFKIETMNAQVTFFN